MKQAGHFTARLKPLRATSRWVAANLPELNFITIHYFYFLSTCLVTAIIFWGSSSPAHSVRFIDSFFFTVSAMTEAGLNTVNLSTLNTWQQIMLFLLIMMGSAIFVSAWVVHVRRKAFEVRILWEIEREADRRGTSKSWRPLRALSQKVPLAPSGQDVEPKALPKSNGPHEHLSLAQDDHPSTRGGELPGDHEANSSQPTAAVSSGEPDVNDSEPIQHPPRAGIGTDDEPSHGDRIAFASDVRFRARRQDTTGANAHGQTFMSRVLSHHGVGAQPQASLRRLSLQTPQRSSLDDRRELSRHTRTSQRDSYALPSAVISRNSTFHHLTEDDRLRLGGTEYRAVVFLSWIVPIYFIAWQLLGCLALAAYISRYHASTCRENGLNPWWVGAFNAVSAFNNSGMSLLDANMTAFNQSVFILLVMSLLILAGNTCYPIFLRLAIWVILKVLPGSEDWADKRVTLQFLLDHPRRCYTNLFPSRHSWWLLVSVITLNGIDCAAYVVLNIGNKAITRFSPGLEFADGLFQAFAVRSGGFYVVNIASVRISLQVLYTIMMYISAFPVAITIRNSNVYEERSLGIYSDDPGYDTASAAGPFSFFRRLLGRQPSETAGYFVQQQLRAQLAHDIWWLVLAVFLIMVIEGGQFERNPTVFSVFNVIFEVVSAYGTVGISIGVPDADYSFSGAWHSLSKLILCAVMIRGRHRGLPVAIDKAVLLPRDYLNDLEEEDAMIRGDRPLSAVATA